MTAGTPSWPLRPVSSGDEAVVSGGKGECAESSGEESLESRGRGDCASGDRMRWGGTLGADFAVAGRVRDGGGEGDTRSTISRCFGGSSSSLIRSIISCGECLDLEEAAPRDGRDAMKLPDTRLAFELRKACARWLILVTISPQPPL